MTHDLDTDDSRLAMVRVALTAIVDGQPPIPLAKAGLDFCDRTQTERLAMRGETAEAASDDWRWYSGTSDEWYQNGPFDTREAALAELDGALGYLVEARPALPLRLNADQLLEDQFFENNDTFDFDHSEPDRAGPAADVAFADHELQMLLDGWCNRHAHTFARGNLFSATRNGERVNAPNTDG